MVSSYAHSACVRSAVVTIISRSWIHLDGEGRDEIGYWTYDEWELPMWVVPLLVLIAGTAALILMLALTS